MTFLSRLVGGLRALFQSRRTEVELDEELRAYLDAAVEEKMAAGLSRDAAIRAARVEMGSPEAVKDQVREVGWEWLVDNIWQDVRYAIRTLRASPGFAAVAILTLAIGIGANSAIFSVVNSLLLRDLPVVAEPQRLARIAAGTAVDTVGRRCNWPECQDFWIYQIWEQIRLRADLFDGTFAWSGAAFNLASGGEMQPIEALFGSGSFFTTLGVPALIGRTFTEADDVPGGGPDGPVAVISYNCWQRRFGGTDDVIGSPLVLEGIRFTIIGVTPPGFVGLTVGNAFEVAVPIGTDSLIRGVDAFMNSYNDELIIMTRLKAGQSLDQGIAALRAVQPQIREGVLPMVPPEYGNDFLKEPLTLLPTAAGTSGLRSRYELPLLTIFAVVIIVLLIACANIGNLLFARGTSRGQELSVRLALGASRARVVRQLLVESLLLAAAGAGLGLGLAAWGSRALVAQLPSGFGHHRPVLDLSLDWRVLMFTAVVGLFTAALFGIVPALRATRVAPIDALRHRGPADGLRTRLSGGLVVVQIALSLTLVVAAGLFVRTFERLTRVPLGFDSDRVLLVIADAGRAPINPANRRLFFQQAVEAVATVPGVAAAAGSTDTPGLGSVFCRMPVDAPSTPTMTAQERESCWNFVTPGWFSTYGVSLHSGRDLDQRDTRGALPVMLVNQAFARRFFPDTDVIGQTVVIGQHAGKPAGPRVIVGVVGDARPSLREQLRPTMYLPLAQWDFPFPVFPRIFINVRPTAGPPLALAPSVSAALRGFAPHLAFMFRTHGEQVGASIAQERLIAMVSGLFALLALLLAGLGLYGITAYAVARRRSEIGIRIALGAERADIMTLVLGRSLAMTAAGIALGLIAAGAVTRFLERMLFGVTPLDPATFAVVALLFAVVTALAAFLPARRATTVDPLTALRSE